MLYIFIQLILVFLCLAITNDKRRDIAYKAMFIILTLLLVFRYGQGTDYFNYNVIYNNLSGYNNVFNAGDPGFNLLILLSKEIGIKFILFNAIIAIISMGFIYRFFEKFCKNKILALTIFYPLYYIVFWFSAIRQGFTMSIFLGILLPLLYKKKYILYIIGTIITASFHLSAAFLLVLVVVRFIPLYNKKVFGSILSGIVIYHILGVQDLLISLLPSNFQYRISTYLSDGISISALGNRVAFFVIVVALYLFFKEKDEESDKFLLNIYIFGFFLYLCLMTSPAIASRLNFYIKILDCVLLANFLPKEYKNKLSMASVAMVCSLVCLLLIKNINSLLVQGDYYSHISLINYPYISIFNKDDIHSYRQISEDIRYKSLFPSKYQWPVEIDKDLESLIKNKE